MDVADSLTKWSCRRLCHCGLAAVPGRTRIGAPVLDVYGSVGLGRGPAFWAEKWAALGDGAPGAVDDEGESGLGGFLVWPGLSRGSRIVWSGSGFRWP